MGLSINIKCDDCGEEVYFNETKSTVAYKLARDIEWEVIGRRTTCPTCVASRLAPLNQGTPIVVGHWTVRRYGTKVTAIFDDNRFPTHATLSADGTWVWENVYAVPRYVRHYVQTGVFLW
jgi:hypothetical protein